MARDMTLTAWFGRENIVRKQKLIKEICTFLTYIAMYLKVEIDPNVYTLDINVCLNENSCLYRGNYITSSSQLVKI